MLVILKIIKLNAFLSALWNALCILFPVRHLYRRGSATSPRQCLGIFRYFEMSNLQQQRKIVEQLRREAGLKRMEVSAAVEDLKVRCQTLRKCVPGFCKVLSVGITTA
ncbi:hypothetical protein V5799_023872 [Amblyomma americanum]|uniref:G protein gamma domain-containing protein n=1 Tax=Amblyomma americanum TaxID=6943 RepID=A0AAQ4FIE2_AMBAM